MPELRYYFAPQSPWSFLGHARLAGLVRQHGIEAQLRPCDMVRVFAASGGLPLAQRARQRQDYRLVELARFSKALNTPINLHPKFFPVSGDSGGRLIIAATQIGTAEDALNLAGALGRACWQEERNIADWETLSAIAAGLGYDALALVARAQSEDCARDYAAYTDEAIAAGVFGAPTYWLDGELFWGQDRLEFLAHALDRAE